MGHKTTSINLERVREYLESVRFAEDRRERARRHLERLRSSIESVPKSLGWRMRAVTGDRLRWYDLPEDPARDRVTVT